MMRRCMGCMREYDPRYDICPHCGYVYGTPAQSQSYLPPGTILEGRYMLGKVLGKGGFGITYIAWDQKLEKAVAIKEFFPTAFASRATGQYDITCFDADAQQMFDAGLQKMLTESRMLAKFSGQSGVVQVLDCVQENGTAYIIMELLRGETVKTILAREKKLSLDYTMQIITPVLQTLESIHETGLVHRDISPDNLFVCEDGGSAAQRPTVKLLDFGAARVANGLDHKTLTIVLKKGFAPAEQYSSSGRQGPFTDVYAVCATMYMMLTGVVPPGSLDRMNDDTLPPLSRYADVPPEVERVILKGMAIKAEDRIRTAGELLRQLQSAAEKSAKKTAKPTEKKNTAHTAKKSRAADKKTLHRVLLAAGALVLVAAIVFGIVAVRQTGVFSSALPRDMAAGDTVTFGTYEAQPIEWTVLARDGDEALLLSREAIDYRQYHAGSGLTFTWQTCAVREWLNTTFYEAAFSAQEKEQIVLQSTENPDNPYTLSAGCADTADRCFLLSMQEATEYLPLWADRRVSCAPSLTEKGEGGIDADTGFVWWALRSPGDAAPAEGNMYFACVSPEGYYDFDNDGLQSAFIRPAIRVNVRKRSGDAETAHVSEYREHLGDFSWEVQGNTLYIRGSGVMRELSSSEFDSVRAEVTAAVIEDGFTTIADSLFMNFAALESVQIPDSVQEIGCFAFRNCPKLQTIRLPSGLRRMGYSVFYQSGVASDKKYWRDDLFCIGNCLIRASKGITGKVEIPDNITVIAQRAFEECTLTEVVIPDGITRLDQSFPNCAKLRSVHVPDSVTDIRGAFDFCDSLTDVQLPSGLQNLESGFYGCDSLETIRLPKSLRRIGSQAFCSCWSLREVTLYNNMKIIEDSVFFNCPLETVNFIGTQSAWDSIAVADGNESLLEAERNYLTKDTAAEKTAATTAPSPFAALKVGDTFTFGTYDRDGESANGAEAIEWIVLERDGDAGTLFAVSTYGLENRQYHNKDAAVTWETCDLRRWLNDVFYKSAFTEAEKKRIVLSAVENADNAEQGSDGGAQTQDYVFLLSIDEVKRLMPKQTDRALVPTPHAVANGVKLVEETQRAWWMLRSPGRNNHLCAIVNSKGAIPPFGEMVNQKNGAVRPAMRIRVD